MATVKAVRKDNSAEARQTRKKSRQVYKGKKAKILQKARQSYKLLTPKEKIIHRAHSLMLEAMRHGATEAEGKKIEREYIKRARNKGALHAKHGKLSERRKQAAEAQRDVRAKLKAEAEAERTRHKKALEKISKLKKKPEEKAKLKQAEKQEHAKAIATLAKHRKQATASHRKTMENLKKVGAKLRKPSFKDHISNYKERSISKTGKRLVTEKAGGAANKAEKPRVTSKQLNDAAEAPVKKRGRPAGSKNKPKAEAAPAAAPAKRGRKPKAAPAAAPAAEAPKKRGRKPKAAAAPAAEAPVKKRGRPAGSKNKPKAEAAPAAAPAKRGRKPKAAATPAAPAKKAGRTPKQPHWSGKGRKSAEVKAWEAKTGKKATGTTAAKPAAAKPAAAKAPKKAATKPAAKPKAAAKPAAEPKAAPKAAAKGGAAKKKPLNF